MNKLSDKQLKIMAFPFTDYQTLLCDGAVRSGKSSIMSVSFIDWAMRSFNNQNFIIAGKTVGSCKRNVVLPYMSLDYAKQKYSLNLRTTDNVLVVKCGNIVNNFYVFGGKDERSHVLVQGLTAAGVLFDEVALFPESFFNQALARCSVEGAKFFMNCNPENPSSYIYQNWILKAEQRNILHLHFTMRDNPSLSEETIQRYENMFTGVFYDRFIKGMWKKAQGLVFEQLATDAEPYMIDYSKIQNVKFEQFDCGIDYGDRVADYAAVSTGIDYDGNVYVIRADKTSGKGITGDDVAMFVHGHADKAEYMTAQSIEFANCEHVETITNTIREKTHLNTRQAYKPELSERPFVINTLLAQKRLFFVKGKCDALIDQLQNLEYDPKAKKDIALDDKSIMNIDLWDAFIYSITRAWHRLLD